MRHDHGSVLPAEIVAKLSSKEVDYFKQYDSLLTEFMTGVDLDITAVQHVVVYCAVVDASGSPAVCCVGGSKRLAGPGLITVHAGPATAEAPVRGSACAARLRRHHDVLRLGDAQEGSACACMHCSHSHCTSPVEAAKNNKADPPACSDHPSHAAA